MPIPTISALNDFALVVTLKTVDLATGKVVPLTSGPVTATLTTVTPPGDLSAVNLAGSATHLGAGKWLLFFDAPGLTTTLIPDPTSSVVVRVDSPGALLFDIPCAYAVTRTVVVA